MAREVPNVPTGLDPQTRNFFSAIREAVNQYTLNGGSDSLNSNLTADNLTGIAASLDSLLSTTIPPIPTGFAVQQMRVNSFLTWDNPYYAYYNFVEIWRKPATLTADLLVTGSVYTITDYGTVNWSAIGAAAPAINAMVVGHEYVITTIGTVNWSSVGLIGDPYIGAVFTKNTVTATGTGAILSASFTKNSTVTTGSGLVKYEPSFTNAVLVGTSNGHIYVDSIDPGAVYAYWIRFISSANIAGPYNANSGTLGGISGDTQENIYGINAWIASADILDGQITNAKIGNTIQSENYNGSTLGWHLSKSGGTVNLNQLTIRDAAGNIILSSGTGIPWAAVAAGSGRPADNATAGATFGSNIYGQITPANVSTYIANAAIKTAQIGDLAVDTLQIAGNAVTIPASAYSAAGQALGGGNQQIQALYIVCAGGGIRIDYGYMSDGYNYSYYNQYCYWLRAGNLNLYRDGSLIKAGGLEFGSVASSFVDYPGAGGHTYSLQYNLVTWMTSVGGGSLSHRYINALEIKK